VLQLSPIHLRAPVVSPGAAPRPNVCSGAEQLQLWGGALFQDDGLYLKPCIRNGRLCRECEQMWNTLRFGRTSARLEELTSGAGFTGGVAERQERLEAAGAAELAWAAGLDCDESDDARRLLGLAARLERLCAFFEQGREPAWPRPPAKPRALAHQLGQTALRTAEETLNIFAGGKIKAGYKALKLAKGGFRVAELFAEYVLSEEFLQAWAMLLEQLSVRTRKTSHAGQPFARARLSRDLSHFTNQNRSL
jgi:hypothetical protein